jgi:hypothetical protein
MAHSVVFWLCVVLLHVGDCSPGVFGTRGRLHASQHSSRKARA